MSRRLHAVFGVALLLSALSPGFASGEDLHKVKVAHWGHEKILIYLPVYIAKDRGMFEAQDLDVEFLFSGNDDQVFATVLSGDAQFGIGDPIFAAISRERGGPGRVIGTLVGAVANWGVSKTKIEPFEDPRSLNGKTVTTFLPPSTTYTIMAELQKQSGLSQISLLPLAFGTEFAALESGEADIAITIEPQASRLEQQGYTVAWSLADYYGPFSFTGITTTDQVISKDPAFVQRFVNAVHQAMQFAHSNPEAAATVAAENFPTLAPQVTLNAVKRLVSDGSLPKNLVTTEEAWGRTVALRKEMGDVRDVEKVNEAVNNAFAQEALRAASSTVVSEGTQSEADSQARDLAVSSAHSPSEPQRWEMFFRVIGILADFATLITAVIAAVGSFIYWRWLRWRRVARSIPYFCRFAEKLLYSLKNSPEHKMTRSELARQLDLTRNEENEVNAFLDELADAKAIGVTFRRTIPDEKSPDDTFTLLVDAPEPKLAKAIRFMSC